jgi:protein-disulfide isomerase
MKRVIITLLVTAILAGAVGYGVPVLMGMSQSMHDRQDAERAAELSRQVAAHRDQLFTDARSPVVGDPAGDVTIVEFFDYQCPYCKAIAGSLDRLVAANKGVRLVLKEFPILGDDSVLASRAALVVPKDKYWAFHQALLQHRGSFDMPTLKNIAKSVGIDADRMEAEMTADATNPPIDANRDLAKAIGIQATPTFIIGDQVIEGAIPADVLNDLIAKARKS